MSARKTTNSSRPPAKLENKLVREILQQCTKNEIPPAIGMLKLTFACGNTEELDAVINKMTDGGSHGNGLAEKKIRALYAENRAACERIMTMPPPEPLSEPATAEARISWLRKSFDRWVEEDSSLSVALYTFGNPDLVRLATQEIIDVLDDWQLLGPEVAALQIGCGTGRVEALLGPNIRLAWGIDISPKMIASARKSLAGMDNVHFSECSGRDLSLFEANSFDLVYGVDSFPYIVEGGTELIESYFAEIARVLHPKGHLVIFHYSYRDDISRDCRDLRRLAKRYGFTVLREGVRPFTVWDGAVYQLQRDQN
jgi:ubiquinone/menaquinone biosynthesis C-methylase UbiE